jgi:hypothetical protein
MQNNGPAGIKLAVCGNKVDLADKRVRRGVPVS